MHRFNTRYGMDHTKFTKSETVLSDTTTALSAVTTCGGEGAGAIV
ncbi:MAG: hypothetical protein ABIQ22_08030 [Arthrobacter oryzae]